MTLRRAVLVIVLAVGLGWLCGSGEPPANRFVGAWDIDVEDFITEKSKNANQQERIAFRKFWTATDWNIRFDLRPDGTLVFTKTLPNRKPDSATGTWKLIAENAQKTVIEFTPDNKQKRSEKLSFSLIDNDTLRVLEPIDFACLFNRVNANSKVKQPKEPKDSPKRPTEPEGGAQPKAPSDLQGERIKIKDSELIVRPIRHGTLVLQWNGKVIYVDPVGGGELFKDLPKPDFVLVTDIHGDHFDLKTLDAVVDPKSRTRIFAPKAVWEKLPTETLGLKTQILNNNEHAETAGLMFQAIPMYNLTPERQNFHTKGRGNGYVLWLIGQGQVYISGDTEDIPEMRKLKDIDVAFVCMNLPYTMDVDAAAGAVLDFKPKIVYPYHYRGAEEKLSDLQRFKMLVGDDRGIEVRIRDWYPKNSAAE